MNRRSRIGQFVLSLVIFITAISIAPPLVRAGQSPSTPAPAAQEAAPAPPAPTDTISGYALSPEKYARAKDHSNQKYLHEFISSLYGLAVLILVLALRLGPKYRDLAQRITSRWVLQVFIYAPLLLLVVAVLGVPTDAWDQQLARSFGLSVQGWASWTTDWITNQLVTLVPFVILVWILYWVIGRSPRRWWFYFWLASIPVLAFTLFLTPFVIEPLFFKFTPLAGSQPVLVAEIEKVIQRGGMDIPPERMFEMNASSKLTGLNAYVSGFGASKRVVVWDNTIKKATIPQTLFVFGHEMGHYVLLHIPKELAIFAGVLLVMLYVGFHFVLWALGRWGATWGIRGPDDLASLPALLLVLGILLFLGTPIFNTISRHFEHEADRYGLEVIHGIVSDPGQTAAHYFQTSGEMNLADPDPSPFIKFWFLDHPSRKDRVDFVVNYDPWKNGEQPAYVK